MTTELFGMILIGVLVLYVVGSVTILGIWSMSNYPKSDAIPAIEKTDDMTEAERFDVVEKRMKILADLRTEWRTTVVAVGTGIAVTPTFTLLGTLVGFVFGSQGR